MLGVVPLDVLLDSVLTFACGRRADTLGQPLIEARAKELGAISVVEHDVLSLDPGGLQPGDDLANDGSVGNDVRLTDRIDLDPDHISGREELLPRLDPF